MSECFDIMSIPPIASIVSSDHKAVSRISLPVITDHNDNAD